MSDQNSEGQSASEDEDQSQNGGMSPVSPVEQGAPIAPPSVPAIIDRMRRAATRYQNLEIRVIRQDRIEEALRRRTRQSNRARDLHLVALRARILEVVRRFALAINDRDQQDQIIPITFRLLHRYHQLHNPLEQPINVNEADTALDQIRDLHNQLRERIVQLSRVGQQHVDDIDLDSDVSTNETESSEEAVEILNQIGGVSAELEESQEECQLLATQAAHDRRELEDERQLRTEEVAQAREELDDERALHAEEIVEVRATSQRAREALQAELIRFYEGTIDEMRRSRQNLTRSNLNRTRENVALRRQNTHMREIINQLTDRLEFPDDAEPALAFPVIPPPPPHQPYPDPQPQESESDSYADSNPGAGAGAGAGAVAPQPVAGPRRSRRVAGANPEFEALPTVKKRRRGE